VLCVRRPARRCRSGTPDRQAHQIAFTQRRMASRPRDTRYGGTPAARVYLHAQELILKHPATGGEMTYRAGGFSGNTLLVLRSALTMCGDERLSARSWRGGRMPGWHVDRLGEFSAVAVRAPLTNKQRETRRLGEAVFAARRYNKLLTKRRSQSSVAQASPAKSARQRRGGRIYRFAKTASGLRSASLKAIPSDCSSISGQPRRFLTGDVAAGFSRPQT